MKSIYNILSKFAVLAIFIFCSSAVWSTSVSHQAITSGDYTVYVTYCQENSTYKVIMEGTETAKITGYNNVNLNINGVDGGNISKSYTSTDNGSFTASFTNTPSNVIYGAVELIFYNSTGNVYQNFTNLPTGTFDWSIGCSAGPSITVTKAATTFTGEAAEFNLTYTDGAAITVELDEETLTENTDYTLSGTVLTIVASKMTAGDHSLTVTATNTSGSDDDTVEFTLAAYAAPTVTIGTITSTAGTMAAGYAVTGNPTPTVSSIQIDDNTAITTGFTVEDGEITYSNAVLTQGSHTLKVTVSESAKSATANDTKSFKTSAPASPFCSTKITHLNGGTESTSILLTVVRVSDTDNIRFTLEEADGGFDLDGKVIKINVVSSSVGEQSFTWSSSNKYFDYPLNSTIIDAGKFTVNYVEWGSYVVRQDNLSSFRDIDVNAACVVAPSVDITAGTVTATTVPLSWTTNVDDEDIKNITISIDGKAPIVLTRSGSTWPTSYTASGLTKNTEHTFVINLYYEDGDEPLTSQCQATTSNTTGCAFTSNAKETKDASWSGGCDFPGNNYIINANTTSTSPLAVTVTYTKPSDISPSSVVLAVKSSTSSATITEVGEMTNNGDGTYTLVIDAATLAAQGVSTVGDSLLIGVKNVSTACASGMYCTKFISYAVGEGCNDAYEMTFSKRLSEQHTFTINTSAEIVKVGVRSYGSTSPYTFHVLDTASSSFTLDITDFAVGKYEFLLYDSQDRTSGIKVLQAIY